LSALTGRVIRLIIRNSNARMMSATTMIDTIRIGISIRTRLWSCQNWGNATARGASEGFRVVTAH
jgi:hypothetical protein